METILMFFKQIWATDDRFVDADDVEVIPCR